ncbi:homoserine dehydrogenase [Candidatus Micrarchaeota archaeon]|nr:homoserine dehydrogenase [Candidatus Micrarchaeota archaeon]
MKLLVLGFGHVGRAFLQILPEANGPFSASVCSSHGGIRNISVESETTIQTVRQAANEGKKLDQISGFELFDPLALVQNGDYDVLVDLTPTVLPAAEPSKTYWTAALKRGKSIVTANKGPLATDYGRMQTLANENGASILIEATVAGGTPVFNLARHCLQGPGLLKVEGIVNGSTNYILTRMQEGMGFEEAKTLARQKGYLEADASSDIEGRDALGKAVILANALFGQNTAYANHAAEGISHITLDMVQDAKRKGECFKLIATVDQNTLSVRLKRISLLHPLASIGDAWNALTFYTKNADAITISGRGAGGLPTASAVLNDVLELSKNETATRR